MASIGLLLLFALTRLHNIEAMPVFYDEALYIRWAKLVWAGQVWTAAQDGRLLYIWLASAFWPFSGALWVARTAMVFPELLGLAALISTGRELGSTRAGMIAAGLYILLPVTFFYDRLVLGETMHTPLVALLVLSTVRTFRRNDRRAAVIAGIVLLALWVTKLSGIYWFATPALGLLLIPPSRWRRHVSNLTRVYGTLAIGWIAFMLLVRRAGYDFGLTLSQRSTSLLPSLDRILFHLRSLVEFIPSTYVPTGFLVVIGIGTAVALRYRPRAAAALLAMTIAPFVGIALTVGRFEVRFLVPVVATLVLATALGWRFLLADRLSVFTRSAASALFVIILALPSVRFMWSGWYSPTAMPLPTQERDEYLLGWSAGAGIPEAAAFVRSAADRQPTDLVVMDVGLIEFLSTYLGSEPNLYTLHDYDEPDLRIKVLYEGLDNPYASLAHPCRQVLILARSPDELERVTALVVPVEKRLTIRRPSAGSQMSSYEIFQSYPTEDVLEVHAPQGCNAPAQGARN